MSGLQEIYDSMEDGADKIALGEQLEEWSPMIEQAEEDLASLPTEVVNKLKFEYSNSHFLLDKGGEWGYTHIIK